MTSLTIILDSAIKATKIDSIRFVTILDSKLLRNAK